MIMPIGVRPKGNIVSKPVIPIAPLSQTGIVEFERALGGCIKFGEITMGRRVAKRSYNRFYRQGPRVPVMWQNVGVGILAAVACGIAALIIF